MNALMKLIANLQAVKTLSQEHIQQGHKAIQHAVNDTEITITRLPNVDEQIEARKRHLLDKPLTDSPINPIDGQIEERKRHSNV